MSDDHDGCEFVNVSSGTGHTSSKRTCLEPVCTRRFEIISFKSVPTCLAGSVAKWLVCWTQAQKVVGSNRSSDAVGLQS